MNENKVILIQKMIYEIRGQKVMLDSDLAKLYEVEVKALNRAVKRNAKRFPDDFMFQLSNKEWENLKCHFGTSSLRYQNGTAKMVKKIRYNPFAFTEQGISMLSGLLNSDIAINVNIQIMRAFVQLRQYVFSQSGTNDQIAELRKLLMLYIEKNDKRVNEIIIALNNLIAQPPESKRKIGFKPD
ncbi:MAG: ORF6N domain-containing protein [Spirochaetaceae bacterium]|nr:ORF6N domain-containing protein [Spirochaetaceae bacterium]